MFSGRLVDKRAKPTSGKSSQQLKAYGRTSVRQFVEATRALDSLTPKLWQQDSFGQLNAWLSEIGIKSGLRSAR